MSRENPGKKRSQENKPKLAENELIFGRHPVLQLLEEKAQINKLFLQKGLAGKIITDILELVKQQGIVYQEVPKAKLDELTDNGNHQGVVVTVPPFAYSEIDDAFNLASQRKEDPFLLILDGIEDPHNFGSIIRTAAAAGVHGIIIPKRRAVGITGTVSKTSVGTVEQIPIIRVTNLAQVIRSLQERGIWVFATDMKGEDMRQWNSQGAVAIVIGNEGRGVSTNITNIADGTITIPMAGDVESLNASVAAAILIYEVARHRIP